MNYKTMAENILSASGNKENVERVFHCATRLRLDLVDIKVIDKKRIEELDGVAGINIAGNQLQVIVGTDVTNVYNEMNKLVGNIKEDAKKEKEGFISLIAGIFTPIIPAIIGGGMIKAILALLVAFSWISSDSQSYAILNIIGDAVFYFLPFMIAYTSSQKCHTNSFISMTFAAVLMYPTLSTLGGESGHVALFGIPVVSATYASSVIPIILTVWLQSYVEKLFEYIWKPVRSFLKPTLTLLVIAPIMLIAIGPLGTWCGDLMASGLSAINNVVPWLPPVLMGAFSPLIVMTGMHYSLIPLAISQVTTLGYITIDLPGMLAANVAQGGAALCVALKSKNAKMKQLALSSGFTAVMGITEPAMYGVNLKLKRPFIAVMIGGAAGGLYAGLAGLKCFAPGSPGLATLPLFLGGDDPMGNVLKAIITLSIAFVVAFIATWILGFEEEVKVEKEITLDLTSPVKGKVIPLAEVNDNTFSSGLMGKGCAIIPEDNKVYAPCSGVITSLFPSKHAIGITNDEGVDILIHVGINTVKLEGKGFEVFVSQGDRINDGQKLLEFDKEAMEKAGYDTIIPVIILNSSQLNDVKVIGKGKTDNKKPLLSIC